MKRSSDARDRLLGAADTLFRDRGFSAIGVAEICSIADVNKGSFYHFFPSKRALLVEVVESAWDETGMLAAWETTPPQHPVEQLRKFLKELFAVHYADKESHGSVRGSLLSNISHEVATSDTEIADKLTDLFKRETSAFESLLTAAVDRGEVSVGNPRSAAEALVGCVHGLIMLAKVRNDLSVLPQSETDIFRLAGVIQQWL